MRAIPQIAVDFITSKEGVRLVGYPDSKGLPTVGVGHAGPDVRIGETITLDQAKALLAEDLQTAASRLQARIGPIMDSLADNQFAALLSFVFNVGARESWGIWAAIRSKRYGDVPAELNKFVYAGGVKIKGLVKRRADEGALWMSDVKPSSAPKVGLAPVALAAAPVVVAIAHHNSALWPLVLAIGLSLALAGLVYLVISSRKHHMASITDTATAIESAATALNAAATELTASATAVAAAIAAGSNSTALDQPLADLATATTAVQTAADAIKTAAGG